MIEAGSPSEEFSREEGAPQSKEEWEALSSEEKALWEQRRRRRKFIRRHGHRAKGLAQIVNPQDRSTQLGLRGRGHLRARDVEVRIPTPEQLSDKPGLEPIRPIPDSGTRGPDGNLYTQDLRMIRRSTRERWKFTEDMTHEVPQTLLKIINANDGDNGRPEIGIQAARALAQFMAQNQADEHEEIKRSSLTKEQASELVRLLIETVQTEVDDPAVRQRIASKLGMGLMAMGVVATHHAPLSDTLAHPKYES